MFDHSEIRFSHSTTFPQIFSIPFVEVVATHQADPTSDWWHKHGGGGFRIDEMSPKKMIQSNF